MSFLQQAVQLIEGSDQVFLIVVGEVLQTVDDAADADALIFEKGFFADGR